MVTKNTEKDQFTLVDERFDVLMLEQYRMLRVTIYQAPIPPDWHEATVIVSNRIRDPIEILTPFAASIDERTAKYIVILHLPARVQALEKIASVD